MYTLNCRGKILTIERPLVMGILNATPDSFFTGSRINKKENLFERVEKMISEGVDIIDVGGQSTRPGAEKITEEEELERVIDVISQIHTGFPELIISVDSFYSKVVREAVGAGASMVNDVSAGSVDDNMLDTVASLGVPYVLMHMRGTPRNMQDHTHYDDLLKELLDHFIQKLAVCRKSGIRDIIIDPGFGFAKTTQQNFELMKNLNLFFMLDCPILLGLSRKGMIYKTLGVSADDALNGTTVMNTMGLMNGASILRVHDVREAAQAVKLFMAYAAGDGPK